jgi:type I restriction enzyme S subunit
MVIHRAVTRGLDPNVRLKPSGVEWLGDVPEHWERRAVWQLFHIGRGKVTSHEYVGNHPGPYPLYSSQTANDGVMGNIDSFMFEGDYLTWTTDGAHAGTVFRRRGRFSCTNVCGTLLPKARVDLNFMRMAVASETKRQVRLDINPKLMNNMMARIRVSVPPYEEQVEIAACVENVLAPSGFLISRINREIDLLREYRTRLIADVVTGKLDVREAAAQLPDEVEEPEALDQFEAENDGAEAGADDSDAVPEEAEA